MKMRIARDLTDGYIFIDSNSTHDFYIRKVNKGWYCYEFEKGTNINITMAGFNTKKAAIASAKCWATWM